MRASRTLQRLASATTSFALLWAAASCQQRAVCTHVSSTCLALSVEGDESFSSLELTLQLLTDPPSTHTGDISPKSDQPVIQLPTILEVEPPPSLLGTSVRQLGLRGLRDGQAVATAQSDPGFFWPAGGQAQLSLTLRSSTEPVPDGGMLDMYEPAPTLMWRPEMTDQKISLYGVWAGASTQTFAVGEKGSIFSRNAAGVWTKETLSTTGFLAAVTGRVDGTAWVIGQGSGAYRRVATSWMSDANGLSLGSGAALYAVALGATDGELWAGDNQGRVWHRTGPSTAAGTWQPFEQVFTAGEAILGVSSAGGAVFVVGINGRVAVRPNSDPGTAWVHHQFAALPSGNPFPLSGVLAFDKNTALAVGAGGLMVRYVNGTWDPKPQTVNPAGEELLAVWGMRPDRVWVVGNGGFIGRVEGETATTVRNMPMKAFYSVWGRSESDIFAVGYDTQKGESLILHGSP